ncbi:hypothetical protein TNCV_608331 [Trichonephila clavipes]|nr:hypothetical protein TNCV_608331 [Trichonephila clavipes]
MKGNDVIELSSSPWESPIILVKKKDCSDRFSLSLCVDYRRLNDVIKKDSYPLPRIDDTLDTLAGNTWFSALDLKSGCWQVELHPDDKEKTAFTPGKGLWQFKVMPFGLCNAFSTFERLMETVFGGLFIRGLPAIARPLHKLVEAKQKFIGTGDCDNAFNKLKDALTSAPFLAYADIGKQFILDTDASRESIGAVLSQEIDGQEHVFAYFSKCLSKPERNYCVTRKELLAITTALDSWSDESVQKDQLAEKLSWQDITPFHPTTKRYSALWDSLHLINGVLYRKWESTSEIIRWQQQHPGVIDYFTKGPEAYPISDQEASTVSEVLVQHWISRFGVPLQLHFDQVRNIDSAVCKRLCEILAIDKTRTTALHPQSDDMVERFNRTIL